MRATRSFILCTLLHMTGLFFLVTSQPYGEPPASEPNKPLVSERLREYLQCSELKAKKGSLSCPPSFDGFSCWEETAAGHSTSKQCPEHFSDSVQQGFASRVCSNDGTWADSEITALGNYTLCAIDVNVNTTDLEFLEYLAEMVRVLDPSPYSSVETQIAFENCIADVLWKPEPVDENLYCPHTFDGWSCWNTTPANTTIYAPCPSFVHGFIPEKFAFKVCSADGTWFKHPSTNKTWSNYTTCVDQDDLYFRQRIINVYIIGYSVSLIALVISLIIFMSFKSLKCTRIIIHRNLFISFIINNTMWIIWYTCIVSKPGVLLKNKLECQAVHVLVHYFLLCNYFWMFCEGLYLHTLLVVAFVSEGKILKWFYVIGWSLPLVFITLYTIFRSMDPEATAFCWMDETGHSWWLFGPVCATFVLNLFFLVNIVRVLVTKLRAVNSPDTHQTRKAVRATLILIPLLGLHYLITPFRPPPGAPGERLYEIVSAVVTALQGFCVSMIFCFCNGEVLSLIRRKWIQTMSSSGRNGRRMSLAGTTVSVSRKHLNSETEMSGLRSLAAKRVNKVF